MDYNHNGSDWQNNYHTPPGGMPPYPSQYQSPDSQVVLREVTQANENKLSVTALVLGIVTLLFFWVPFIALITGIIGMVLAIIGIIKEEHRVMAIIGMILSVIGLALTSLMVLGYIVQYLMYMN